MSPQGAAPDFLDHVRCRQLAEFVFNAAQGGGFTSFGIRLQWEGRVRWARNFAYSSEEASRDSYWITRARDGAGAVVWSNRFDEAGLRATVAEAESQMALSRRSPVDPPSEPSTLLPHLRPELWSPSTFAMTAEARGDIARAMIAPAEDAGLQCAGELITGAHGIVRFDNRGIDLYYPTTEAICSMTARDQKGMASGWAGIDNQFIERIDPHAISARAVDKCVRSRDPRAVEPGRYTVILEPQAVADLVRVLYSSVAMDRQFTESGGLPFSADRRGFARFGELVMDRRLTLRVDPMDPVAPHLPYAVTDDPYYAATWIDKGVLKDLAYQRHYAMQYLHRNEPLLAQGGFRLEGVGETSTVEQMIRTTRRGFLVTRFSNIQTIDQASVLCTGFTRDGLWLIENGRITHPARNFRFLESPIFMLNNVEQIGTPQRVLSRYFPTVVPALKVRDFNFAGLADAV
ncbi:MAG: hypothetical protein KF689_11475 [Gemmatimonadaceae bacterium]|nr:hypothetical protein [Gemmatimonadaceae bacterium]MCW5825783.1 hypothetical protein [Gemmatimonadaceae bacterium]